MQEPDLHALREAFEAHHRALVDLCSLLTGSQTEGEDLAQEAFVRAAPHIAGIESASVKPYLRRVAMNAWKNQLRSRAVWNRHAYRLMAVPDDSDPMRRTDDQDALWRALRALPPRQRSCIVLRYYEDLSEREIAKTLGCAVGTVKSQTSKALRRLEREVRTYE